MIQSTGAMAKATLHGRAARGASGSPPAEPRTTIHAVGMAAATTRVLQPTGGYAQPKSTPATAANTDAQASSRTAARRAFMGAAVSGNRHFPE